MDILVVLTVTTCKRIILEFNLMQSPALPHNDDTVGADTAAWTYWIVFRFLPPYVFDWLREDELKTIARTLDDSFGSLLHLSHVTLESRTTEDECIRLMSEHLTQTRRRNTLRSRSSEEATAHTMAFLERSGGEQSPPSQPLSPYWYQPAFARDRAHQFGVE